MISGVFIARPRLAIVISLVITIAGLLSLFTLPVAQYPNITPPVVQVSASYPGADASTIAQTVGAPIEQQVNGVKGMMYMSSTSSSSGTYSLQVTFALGTDPDLAQVNTQNRVALATSQLPAIVNSLGVNVQQQSTSMLAVINVSSDDPSQDPIFISNYTSINLQPALARVPGVGSTTLFGALNYSMRIWLDVDRMTALSITPGDVAAAIEGQNIQASLGQIGGAPIASDQVLQYTVETKGRLLEPSEFENIVLRSGGNGAVVRIRDIGRVELGAQSYNQTSRLNGVPAATLAIYQLPNANALSVARQVRTQLAQLQSRFPPNLKAEVIYDSTLFVSASIKEIAETLGLTAIVVLLVVFIFLQDLRATIIPAVTIPVSLIGVFAIFQIAGYSANTISLFAIVLAIGLVVDDAIVVVENVQRIMEEEGASPREAALRAMEQVTGPIVSTTLVLFAVFGPVAFLPGITGELYRQFAVTISAAVAISAVNALTLSPALCAVVLRPPKHRTSGPFALFNSGLDRIRHRYVGIAGLIARRSVVAGLIVLVAGAAAALGFIRLPTSFLPSEDQGVMFVDVQLPDAAALPRTEAIMGEVGLDCALAPGRGQCHHRLRLQPSDECALIEQRSWHRGPQALVGADQRRDEPRGDLSEAPQRICGAARSQCHALPAAGHSRTRCFGRVRFPAGGGGQSNAGGSCHRAALRYRHRQPGPAHRARLFDLFGIGSPPLHGLEPRKGREPRCVRRRSVRDDAGDARVLLCQPVQLSGPDVPGQHSGGCLLPLTGQRHLPPLRP